MPDLSLDEISDALPFAIWLPRSSYDVYRGTPSEIIRELTGGKATTVRQAIKKVTKSLEVTRRVRLQLPWEESDEVLATLVVHAMLELGISQPVPSA